jgi:flagellar motor protein MotB
MGEDKGKMLIGGVIWVTVIGLAVLGYRFWWAPQKVKQAAEQAKEEHRQTLEKTSTNSRYTSTVSLGIDSFSGYSPFRTQTFRDECAKYGIRIEYVDDGANYQKRLQNISDGKIDMAVFTFDALMKCSSILNDIPATIVLPTDESKGADAALCAGKMFPNLDSVNDPDVKIVCVRNSPSETMFRVCMTNFNLSRMAADPFEFYDSAEEVYRQYLHGKLSDKKIFVMWEPYVSKTLQNPDYHCLIDSSKFRGYIFDGLVARRGFLVKNENVVEQVVKAYLTTIFSCRNGIVEMLMDDAKITGEVLKKEQAEKLSRTIWWKNTQEIYGHFGLVGGSDLQHMEEICRNISDVLLRTQAISKDPTNGRPNMWYYDGIVRRLHDTGWHPGFGQESVRQEKSLLTLTNEEWSKLKPVGTLQVPRLVFSRGTSNLTAASETTLAELADKLKNWPQYYLTVRGNSSSEGDLDANTKLAESRAKAAVEWLVQHGVDKVRVKAETAKPNGSTTVVFILGELPY